MKVAGPVRGHVQRRPGAVDLLAGETGMLAQQVAQSIGVAGADRVNSLYGDRILIVHRVASSRARVLRMPV